MTGIIPTRLWHSLYDEIRGTNIYKVDELKGTSSDVVNLITSEKRLLVILASALKQPRIAIDLESNGLYRYPERVCLVQLATADGIYLLDPLLLGSSAGLGELLANEKIEKIFHSADYDIRSLDRDWGFRIGNLFDTIIAAAFIGSSKLGLAAVLQEYLKIEISKDKKLQRADWTLRPLSKELIDYAADDVRYLLAIHEHLKNQLEALGRSDWSIEEFISLTTMESYQFNIKSTVKRICRTKNPKKKELQRIQSIVSLREKIAIEHNLPTRSIIPNECIISLARQPVDSIEKLTSLKGFSKTSARKYGKQIIEAINEIAPEHLELNVKNFKKYENQIKNAGSICNGPNHTPQQHILSF